MVLSLKSSRPCRSRTFPLPKEFDAQGLGHAGVMLLSTPAGADHPFCDRALMRQLLLSGKSSTSINKLVDSFGSNVSCNAGTKKRKKIRPAKAEVVAVVQAAFEQYPRLGTYTPRGGDAEVVLNAWPNSEAGQKLFHNELMRCCRLSLSHVSQRRAAFYDARPVPEKSELIPAEGAAAVYDARRRFHGVQEGNAIVDGEGHAAAGTSALGPEAPATPPAGYAA